MMIKNWAYPKNVVTLTRTFFGVTRHFGGSPNSQTNPSWRCDKWDFFPSISLNVLGLRSSLSFGFWNITIYSDNSTCSWLGLEMQFEFQSTISSWWFWYANHSPLARGRYFEPKLVTTPSCANPFLGQRPTGWPQPESNSKQDEADPDWLPTDTCTRRPK